MLITKIFILRTLVYLSTMIACSHQQEVYLKQETAKIFALNKTTLKVDWKHLVLGDISLVSTVQARQKTGPGQNWTTLTTVDPSHPLIIRGLPICKIHKKISVTIHPKLGNECHPYCSSAFSQYTPKDFFNNDTSPYSCVNNASDIFIQLDDGMTKDGMGMYEQCIKNVKIYEDGELLKFREKVTLEESRSTEIKKEGDFSFFDLVYEVIDATKDKTSTIKTKRLEKEEISPTCDESPEKGEIQSHEQYSGEDNHNTENKISVGAIFGILLGLVFIIGMGVSVLAGHRVLSAKKKRCDGQIENQVEIVSNPLLKESLCHNS